MDHGFQRQLVIGEYLFHHGVKILFLTGNHFSPFQMTSNNKLSIFHYCSAVLRLTALILKVLSLMAERQSVAFGEKGRKTTIAPDEKIKNLVNYLLTAQNTDGSFRDPDPVLHRGVLVTSTFMLEHERTILVSTHLALI